MIFFIFLISFISTINTFERITSFKSDIIVYQDGTLLTTETIEVVSEGITIKHGIVREFPTHYNDYLGSRYVVDFKLISITQDGAPASFFIQNASNGKKIYIGDKNKYITQGKHNYVISYETNRQIGFFEKHDELYLNITGNGWCLPIEHVEARIHLPKGINFKSIGAEGYTGYQDAKEQSYTSSVENSFVSFATTCNLQAQEGLTIVVTFPKSFVAEPSLYKKIYWALHDNWYSASLCLLLLLLLGLLISAFMTTQRLNKSGTVIPLFYPPENLTPSDVGFMKALQFNYELLSIDIVNLAVHGFITIAYKKGAFLGGTYTLTRTSQKSNDALTQDINARYQNLLSILFGKKQNFFSMIFNKEDTLVISEKESVTLKNALYETEKTCTQSVGMYIKKLSHLFYKIGVVSILFILLMYFGSFEIKSSLDLTLEITIIIALISSLIIVHKYCSVYTPEGRTLQDKIDGFALYLKTAEVERMKIIGTPPTKTPELYEKYLPYAMALGVEKQWTNQFTAIFEALTRAGHPYTPHWCIGPQFKTQQLGSSLKSSISNSIVSAARPSVRSSGSGGSGKSGGGSGGGGGGGW